METILSLIALITIALLASNYAFKGGSYSVKSPVNLKQKFKVSSRHRLVLLLLSVGFVQAGSYSSLLLLVWIILLIILLMKYGTNFTKYKLFFFYGIYLVWLLFSLIFTPETEHGLRVFAKYLFPFLVIAFVSKIKINDVFFF